MWRFAAGSMRGGLRNASSDSSTVCDMAKGARSSRDATIDFRMLRRAYLARVHAGDVPHHDACDASTDLVRAAEHYGTQRRASCPLCGQQDLRNVTYLFGPRLPRSGRCITNSRQLHEVGSRPERFVGYVVEVCIGCRWNHLLSANPYGGRGSRSRERSRLRRRA